MSTDELQIIETKKISNIKNCIIGMPDTGLTGMIGVTHLISSLSLDEIGYFDSHILPPVMVIHKGIPKQPIRLFGNKDLAAITSETPLNMTSMYPLAKNVVNWVKSKGVELLISISGVAVQNRIEIKNPLVYGVTTFANNKELLDKAKVKLLEEGFMVGPHALILKECIAKKVNNLTLLAQSHPQYPDPGAAAATVNSINKLLDLNVDVNKLLEQAEEIRLKTRELMQRTAKSLKGMEKVQEQELPVMYG